MDVKRAQVIGLDISQDNESYRVSYDGIPSLRMDVGELFDSEDAAWKHAWAMRDEYDQREEQRLHAKCDDQKSWAWHVSYHRREIREAKKRIEYHEQALGIAKEKVKK